MNKFSMNPGPFPKPPTAKPLPEQEWLRRTDRAEVGREPFFCGRDAEYEVFRNAVLSLRDGNIGGGTMVFQGAPGAGKSALMLECMEAVRLHSNPQDPWVAVCVSPTILDSPEDLMIAMVNATHQESQRLLAIDSQNSTSPLNRLLELGKALLAELSDRGFSLSGISVGGKLQDKGGSGSNLTADSAFRTMAPLLREFRVVVFVDEAQNTPEGTTTKAVLDYLHRDPKGIPLVAAFFGLSDTKDVLRRCGLSRLSSQRIVNLDPLPLTDAKASIRHMIDVYYTGTGEQKESWTNALAELSQGWPQHINRAGVSVGLTLADNDTRKLDDHLLEQALEKANELKSEYYEQRVEAGYPQADLYIELALAAVQNADRVLSVDELRNLSAPELEKTRTSFDDFLRQSLHAGLLAPAKGLLTRYKFPIPSLGDYLRSAATAPVNPD